MSQHITDAEHREFIASHYDLIEFAIQAARMHMAGGPDSRPEVINGMFVTIGQLAVRGQQFTWPDPAKRAQAARQDAALQLLIKRASKPTPIRAGRTVKGVK